jgi:hypothetical protein
VFDLHKLQDIEILHDGDGILGDLRRGARLVGPRNALVGRQIDLVKKQLSRIEQNLRAGKPDEAILNARRVLMSSLMLHLLAAKGCMSSKISHLYPELKIRFPPDQTDTFEFVQMLRELDGKKAAKRIDEIRDFSRRLFDRR